MAATAIALVGAGMAAAGTVGSYFEQKKAGRKAERKQDKARATSQASAQVENARARRRAIAQARVAEAQNVAAQSQQVQSSSSIGGVQSSIGAQLGSNIGAQQQRIGSQIRVGNLQQEAANALRKGQERAGMWSAVGSIGQMGFQAAAPSAKFGATQEPGQSGAFVQPSARPTRPTF